MTQLEKRPNGLRQVGIRTGPLTDHHAARSKVQFMMQAHNMHPSPQPSGLSDEDKWNIVRIQSLIYHKVSDSMGDHYAMFPCDRPVRGLVVTRDNER